MKRANSNLPSLNVNCTFSTIMGSEACPAGVMEKIEKNEFFVLKLKEKTPFDLAYN